MPALGVAVGVGGHRHRHNFVLRQLLPQKLHKFRVGVPVLVGDILNVHIHPVQAVPDHRPGDLLRQLFSIVQGLPPQLPVPVVAEEGDHPHPALVHLFHKGGGVAPAGEVQGAVGI